MDIYCETSGSSKLSETSETINVSKVMKLFGAHSSSELFGL